MRQLEKMAFNVLWFIYEILTYDRLIFLCLSYYSMEILINFSF